MGREHVVKNVLRRLDFDSGPPITNILHLDVHRAFRVVVEGESPMYDVTRDIFRKKNCVV